MPRIGTIADARPDGLLISRQPDILQLEFAERIDGDDWVECVAGPVQGMKDR